MPNDYDYSYKVGDTWPPIRAYLRNSDGTVIDLSEVTGIVLRAENVADASVSFGGDATIDVAEEAIVSYTLADDDLDVGGVYELEWTLTSPSGRQTVPGEGRMSLLVERRVA